MARTTLSQKSFYVYSRDPADPLASLLMPLRADADAALARRRSASDSVRAGALRSAAILSREHGAPLRALAHASFHDPEVARVWRGAVDQVITVAREQIEGANRTGLHPPLPVE